MAILDANLRQSLAEAFSALDRDVALTLSPGPEGEAADLMRRLVAEVAELSPRLACTIAGDGPPVEPGRPADARVEGPILTVARAGDAAPRLRFLGVTGGMEFPTLVHAILDAAGPPPAVEPETRQLLGALSDPVHLQVFSTPT